MILLLIRIGTWNTIIAYERKYIIWANRITSLKWRDSRKKKKMRRQEFMEHKILRMHSLRARSPIKLNWMLKVLPKCHIEFNRVLLELVNYFNVREMGRAPYTIHISFPGHELIVRVVDIRNDASESVIKFILLTHAQNWYRGDGLFQHKQG